MFVITTFIFIYSVLSTDLSMSLNHTSSIIYLPILKKGPVKINNVPISISLLSFVILMAQPTFKKISLEKLYIYIT